MQSYRDSIFSQLLQQMLFPRGEYEEKNGERIPIAPEKVSPYDRRGLMAQASLKEDEKLRAELGYSRNLGKNERLPQGSYALADYPGLSWDIWNASTGNNPRGGMAGAIPPGSPEDLRLQELRKLWAANQQAMMPQGNFVSRM